MKRFNISKRIYSNLFVIMSFIILSILEIYLIWPHHILNGNDFYFHLNRLEELVKSNNIFPQYAFNSFSNVGSAVMTMYPYLFLYPFAILIKVTNNINLIIYLMFIFNAFITLLISYFSSRSLSVSKLDSYVFAITYSLSYEYISLNFWSSDLGMSWTATFIPLVLFGFVYWIRNNKWLMLSIGMTLVIYSNVTIAAFTPVLLLIWTLFNYKSINRSRIINLIKALILTTLSTSLFWIPAFKLLLLNHHFIGSVNINGKVLPIGAESSILSTLNPLKSLTFNFWWPWELTIPALLGIIIGIIGFKYLSKVLRQFCLFSLFVLFLSTKYFPWSNPHLFRIEGLLQTPIRLYLIPQVLLSYIFAIYFVKILNKLDKNRVILTSIISVMCLLIIQVGYIGIFHSQQTSRNFHANGIIHTSFFHSPFHKSPNGNEDYYIGSQSNAKLINCGVGIAYPHRHILFKNHSNGYLSFVNSKNIKELKLPILKYKGTNYKCKLDNKHVKSFSKEKLVTIKNIHKGFHTIKIHTLLNCDTMLSWILTLVGIITYVTSMIEYAVRYCNKLKYNVGG